MDAFVCTLEFFSPTATTSTETKLYYTIAQKVTAVTDTTKATGTSLGWGQDWTADTSGVLVGSDTSPNDIGLYSVSTSDTTKTTTWTECDEEIIINEYFKQCAMIKLNLERKFKSTDTQDVSLDYRKFRIGAGWNLVTVGTVVTSTTTLLAAAAKYSTSDPPTVLFDS